MKKNISLQKRNEMQKLDLSSFIDKSSFDKKEIALRLFPHAKFPDMALARVLKGAGQLDEDQLSRLAHMHGLNISELYIKTSWELKGVEGALIMNMGKYAAVIDTTANPMISRLHDSGTLFHETLIHAKSATFSDLKSLYEEEIRKHEATTK
jgi:hypothetical protein